MVDYRNILRLQSQGHSQREIERELYCSRHTISEVVIRAKAAGIAWPLEDDVTNEDIRRRFSPDKNDISIIRGCFVNKKGGIVSTFSKSPISLPASEAEHYLASFKKTLGGAVGRNQFTLPVHTDDAALLHQLQTTELKDEAAVNELFNTIREKMEFEGSYLILAMHDAYSIPYRKAHEHTDTPDFTDKVFNYVIVSICPVKLTKPLLTFFSDDRDFHTVEPDLAVGGPVLGFMYPVLDGGSADVNSALYYTKDASDLHADFIDAVFHTTAPEASADKREQFYGVLGDSLERGLTFGVVQTIHENLNAQMAEKKKGENLQVGRKEIASLLSSCDVDAAEQKAFDEGYLEQFGAVGLDASLIGSSRKVVGFWQMSFHHIARLRREKYGSEGDLGSCHAA